MSRPLVLALALVVLAACNRAPEPAAPPPPAPSPAPKPRPPPTLAAILVTGVAVEPDGRELPLLSDESPFIHPGSTFKLVFKRRLPDVRLSLLDGDAMIPAEGARELAEGTTVTLKPTGALQAQAVYRLKVDGAATREAHDEDGNTFEPLSVTVRTGGEPRPPVPASKKRR